MTIRVLVVKLKHKDKELQDHLEDKDAEVEQLKTKLISQKEKLKILLKSLKKLEWSIMT